VLDTIRDCIKLPSVDDETPDQTGLRILLDGAQPEFRDMVVKFNNWLHFADTIQTSEKLKYPDLFNGYEAKDANVELAEALTSFDYIRPHWVELNIIKYSLFTLGEKWDTTDILDAANALFQSLESKNLLENFKIIGGLPLNNQGNDSRYQMIMKAESFRRWGRHAPIHQFWLEVICGGKVEQLRYYLTNMLVFNVIPLLISRVLHRNQNDALDLAHEIMQLHGFTKFVQADYFKAHPGYAPNYFESIAIYAIQRNLPDSTAIIHAVLHDKDGKERAAIPFLLDCHAKFRPFSRHNILQNVVGPGPYSPEEQGQLETIWYHQLFSKYMRNFELDMGLNMSFYMKSDEALSDLIVAGLD
ncbi:hypothetical protein H4R34_002078, partial [Dimargaris verticillata]